MKLPGSLGSSELLHRNFISGSSLKRAGRFFSLFFIWGFTGRNQCWAAMREADLANHCASTRPQNTTGLPKSMGARHWAILGTCVPGFCFCASRSIFSYEGKQTIQQLDRGGYEIKVAWRRFGPTDAIKSWYVLAQSGKMLIDWLATLSWVQSGVWCLRA